MARPLSANRRRVIPGIRSTYDEAYNVYRPVGAEPPPPPPFGLPVPMQMQMQMPMPMPVQVPMPMQSAPPAPVVITSNGNDDRLHVLEDRLVMQEMRSQSLVDKAMNIKSDVIEALNFAHGSWKDEKNARAMLQEHIRSITDVVRNLHRDIAGLEREIHSRDAMAAVTTGSVKNLEHAYIGALGEMRNKLARADGAIAQLSGEMRSVHDTLKHASFSQGELANRLADRVAQLENRLGMVGSALDRANTDTAMKLRLVEGESSKMISFLDARSKAIIDDLKNAIANLQMMNENEREKLEQRLLAYIDKNLAARDAHIDKIEQAAMDGINQLTSRCDIFEADIRGLRDSLMRIEALLLALQNRVQLIPVMSTAVLPAAVTTTSHNGGNCDIALRDLERYFNLKLDELNKRFCHDLEKLKRECRDGFVTVHETINNLNKVFEGKLVLLEEQIRKELAMLRKTVVYI